MKKSAFYLLLLFALSCSKSSSESNHEENPFPVPDEQPEAPTFDSYSRDAWQLYMHEIHSNPAHKNYKISVLDSTEVLKILGIIRAVYDTRSPQRDTVFNYYKIHARYCYSLNGIYLRTSSQLSHIQNLSEGKFPTGNTAFDSLLNKYGFDSVRTSYGYPDFPWLTIFTKKNFNLIPVVNEFKSAPGIIDSEFNTGCGGDGSSIRLERNETSATIAFKVGLGDCPGGCTYKRFWEFQVDENGAKFVKAY